MDPQTRLQRFIWVLDIHDFLVYLEDCLYRLSFTYSWLADNERIDLNWPWTETNRITENKTQRDYLIDWIICFILRDLYYFDKGKPERNTEFHAIFHVLENEFDLYKNVKFYTDFPFLVKGYGDIITHQILRQSCWLYIEASYDPSQQPR